ncbi:TerC family protein [Derxia gummosa]|uniref:TerC family protein n=1 Tax=Derxia gummosa DSM 723 TaxID=1121388 RepID=A0A8B6X1T1_9BURK|nr:TerC family protein [Derxia gummosa]
MLDAIPAFADIHWAAVLQIIVIDILLGGDNAVVIALACRNLTPHHRWQGILWGSAGAIVLRIALVAGAMSLLDLPGLKLVGALLLIYIGVKLTLPEDEDHEVDGAKHVLGAVRTIIVADLVMSIDNVIAIAGASQQAGDEHRLAYVVFGLLVSIPFIIFGSQIVLKALDRLPVLVWAGAGLLGYLGGHLLLGDPLAHDFVGHPTPLLDHLSGAVGAALVVVLGHLIGRRMAASGADRT